MNENKTGKQPRTFLFVLGKPCSGRSHFEHLLRERGVNFGSVDMQFVRSFELVHHLIQQHHDKNLFVVTYFPKDLEDVRSLASLPVFKGEWIGLWLDRTDEFCFEKAEQSGNLNLKNFRKEMASFDNFIDTAMEDFCNVCGKSGKKHFHRTEVDVDLDRIIAGPYGLIARLGLDKFVERYHDIPGSESENELVGFSHE